jgi:hypothetical protein
MPFLTPRSVHLGQQAPKNSQDKVNAIVDSVNTGIAAQVKAEKPDKDLINAYASVLTSASALQKSLPINQGLSFSLSREEQLVLFAYALGGLVLTVVFPFFTPWAGWKSTDLASLFLDWSAVFAVLLGASALPQLTGKGGSSSSISGGGAAG